MFAAFTIEEIPAFKTCGYRYTIASVIAFLIYVVSKPDRGIKRKEIKNAMVAGLVFLGLGTGGAIWSLNFIDTGFAALIIAGEPLMIVLMLWAINKRLPSKMVFLGIALGMLGIYLLVSQDVLISTRNEWVGITAILFSMLAWGFGSIFVSKAVLPKSHMLNSAVQMMVGGLACLLISFIIGEPSFKFNELKPITIWSLSYLIVFGSVVAFTAFNYLLQNVATEKVVTNTYVNPVIALILGYLFRDELITTQSIMAAIVLLVGVFFINSNKRKS